MNLPNRHFAAQFLLFGIAHLLHQSQAAVNDRTPAFFELDEIGNILVYRQVDRINPKDSQAPFGYSGHAPPIIGNKIEVMTTDGSIPSTITLKDEHVKLLQDEAAVARVGDDGNIYLLGGKPDLFLKISDDVFSFDAITSVPYKSQMAYVGHSRHNPKARLFVCLDLNAKEIWRFEIEDNSKFSNVLCWATEDILVGILKSRRGSRYEIIDLKGKTVVKSAGAKAIFRVRDKKLSSVDLENLPVVKIVVQF